MKDRDAHPSRFALDRFALGSMGDAEVAAHVHGCGQCAQHVARVQQNLPVPNWVHELGEQRWPRPQRRFVMGWLAWGSGAALAAAVALLVVVGRPGAPPEVRYTTLRGAPSIGLYIKRGSRIALWDGHAAVEPGDRLRLKVVPEGFRYVAVFASHSDASGHPNASSRKPLYASRLKPDGENLLPVAWEVDREPGHEELTIVLGDAPPQRADLKRALRQAEAKTARPRFWVRALRIRKRVSNGRER